jgi:hypothetical protein
MLRLTVPDTMADPHYRVEREDGGEGITVGRSGTSADLWCGDYLWISSAAGRLVHEHENWWLLNPHGKTSLRFITADGTVDLSVRVGGSAPLPPASGRLWIANPEATGVAVVVLVEREGAPLDLVDAAMAEVPPARGTVPIRTDHRLTLDALSVATWHRRKATGYRCLTLGETHQHLGVTEDVVRNAFDAYRRLLTEKHNFVFTGRQKVEELFNIVIDHGLITAFDDEIVLEKYGIPVLEESG